jgi:hypothetical protein
LSPHTDVVLLGGADDHLRLPLIELSLGDPDGLGEVLVGQFRIENLVTVLPTHDLKIAVPLIGHESAITFGPGRKIENESSFVVSLSRRGHFSTDRRSELTQQAQVILASP